MMAFSTKDLLISTAIVAVGCGVLGLVLTRSPLVLPMGFLGNLALFIIAGGIIGAGLFRLAKRPRTGAFIGVLVQIAVYVYLVKASQ